MGTAAARADATYLKGAKTYTDVLKDVVILVPAIHLSVCFVYLYLYYFAFGGNLALFTSPSDVFSVSFVNIAPFYIGLLIQPTVLYIPLWSLEAPVEHKPLSLTDKLFFIVPVALGLVIAGAYSLISGFFPVGSLFFAVFMGSFPFVRTFLRRERRPVKVQIIIALFFAFFFLLFSAIGTGQRDRYAAVDQFPSNARCGQYVVLRSLGDRFLVADSTGKRLIVDDNCRAKFLVGLPNPEYFPEWDLAELVRRSRGALGLR